MEQNRLESVHTIVCDAIAHHFPDWKERSRVSYEIAFKMLGDFIEHKCPLLVHTKLVEPEKDTSKKWDELVDKCNSEMNDFFTELDKMESFKGCFKIKKEPPIDAEGWEKFEGFGYKSLIYTPVYISIDEEFQRGYKLIIVNTRLFNIEIESKNISFYKEKLNIPESDSIQTQAFKIANYICSRLCDKIEK